MATISFTEVIVFNVHTCNTCGCQYGLSENFEKKLRDTHATFYCPNGHGQWYPQDNEAEKLRKELKRKEQELSDEVIRKFAAENERDRIAKNLKKANSQLKRVHNGVCPCCNRSFENLQRHIRNQHPELQDKLPEAFPKK